MSCDKKHDCKCKCVDDIRHNLKHNKREFVFIFGKGGVRYLLGVGVIRKVEDGKVLLVLRVDGLKFITHVNICAIGSFVNIEENNGNLSSLTQANIDSMLRTIRGA
jgi:hypothetical protein